MTFASLLANKLTGECYMRVVRLQMTNKEHCYSFTGKVVFIATGRLSSPGKVKKLKLSGRIRNGPPKTVKAPYAKIFSPYICFLE